MSTLDQYLQDDPQFRQLYDYSRDRFDAAPHLTAHNFEHARRDLINAIAIGEAEGADMHIVLCAAVVHDIGFLYGATGRTHGEVGAHRLPEFLCDGQIKFSESEVSHLQSCLLTHKGSMHGHQPATLEAQVVADADLLEKLGPVGMYQSIRTFTEFNLPAEVVVTRLQKMDDLTLSTPTGQAMANQLRPYTVKFAQAMRAAFTEYSQKAKLTSYLESDHLFNQLYLFVEKRLAAAPQLTAHNFEHSRRDVQNAIVIGETEGADMHIVLCAAILHDIGYLFGGTGRTHGDIGADKLDEYLHGSGINIPAPELEHIRTCIKTHKGSVHGIVPDSIEAKVVSDADMLEKIGPVGLYQFIRSLTEFNFDIDITIERLQGADKRQLCTNTGNQLAQQRRGFASQFATDLAEAYQVYR